MTWCSRKQAQARHIHALTMSRPGIHCVETQSLVMYLYSVGIHKRDQAQVEPKSAQVYSCLY